MTLPHSLDPLAYPARFQFQSGAPCNGASTCTDTVIQMIVEYYKEKTYSLSTIRSLAQRGTNFDHSPCTGINYVEALNALSNLGVRGYQVAYGKDLNFVASKMLIGPVLVGVEGGSYPNSAHSCGGVKAEVGGRTQCNFTGAHAILALKYQRHIVNGKTIHWDYITRDPNHNSPARPEKPAYDRITNAQLTKAMQDLPKYTAFSDTYCIYPTKRKDLNHL